MIDSVISNRSLVVSVDILEMKLVQISEEIGKYIEDKRVFEKKEILGLLSERFQLTHPSKSLVLHFLRKFKFLRKIVRKEKTFYNIGDRKDANTEEHEVDLKLMEIGLGKMISKKDALVEEVKQLFKKAKSTEDKLSSKKLKMECVTKGKIVSKLKKQIALMESKVNQMASIKDDVEMMKVMKDTQLDPTQLETVTAELNNNLNIQREIREQQEQLSTILQSATEPADDMLDQMFNALDEQGVPDENFDRVYEESGMKIKKSSIEREGVVNEFQSDRNLEQDLLESKETIKSREKKIYGIDDVVRYQRQKTGHFIEEEALEVVDDQNRTLIFNNRQNGLRKEATSGKSYSEFKKQKSQEEEVPEEKIIEEETQVTNGNLNFFNKLKDKVFGSGKKSPAETDLKKVKKSVEKEDLEEDQKEEIKEEITNNNEMIQEPETDKVKKKNSAIEKSEQIIDKEDYQTEQNNEQGQIKDQVEIVEHKETNEQERKIIEVKDEIPKNEDPEEENSEEDGLEGLEELDESEDDPNDPNYFLEKDPEVPDQIEELKNEEAELKSSEAGIIYFLS